jgi:hypothetical protein
VGAPKPWGPMSLGGPQALGAPRLSLVSLVGNPPLVGGSQIGESISSIKGMKKELLQKTAFFEWNKTKPKKTKDSDCWFSLLNAPWNPLGPPTHGGPQPFGAPNPWGPPTHGGPQTMGAAILGAPTLGDFQALWTPTLLGHWAGKPWGPPTLGPQALGAPEPRGPLGQT